MVDYKQTISGDGNPVFENEDDCVYIFTWPTKYACLDHLAEQSCRVDVGDKKYDLGPLSRRSGKLRKFYLYSYSVCVLKRRISEFFYQ